MTIQIGDKLPPVHFITMGESGPEPVDESFFAGRKVALFSVPGAYTPTCSARHLPGFVEEAEALQAKGVDVVACTAVNDIFVLTSWAKANEAERITMLADGNAAFVRSIGLDADFTSYGMGVRGQRFSMLVEDGVVRQLNVEEPGGFSVSSADHLLAQI